MKAKFVRKAYAAEEFESLEKGIMGNEFVIEKIIGLDAESYEYFRNNLLEDYEYIKSSIDLMRVDTEGKWHCILIKEEGKNEGILVESEGYEYARYSAYYKVEEDEK